MFENNQTLVPEALLYCKTLFMRHTSLLLGPATLRKTLGMSIIISSFYVSHLYFKMSILLQISFAQNTACSDKISFVELSSPNLAASKGFGSMYKYVHLQLHSSSLVSSCCTGGGCNGIAFIFPKKF
jgi:hypothetical protein